MKKSIIITLIISLVMCLYMAFPASAAYPNISLSTYPVFYNYVNAWIVDNPDYCYVAYFNLPIDSKGNNYRAICFNTENPVADSPCYALWYSDWDSSKKMGVNSNLYFKEVKKLGSSLAIYWTTSNVTATHYFPNISTVNLTVDSAFLYNLTNVVAPPNTSSLKSLITQAKAMQNTGYTQSSWNALQAQITAAENLLAITGYTQAQVDNATNALRAALDGLVLLPHTNDLSSLLTVAESIEDIGYTEESWSRLQSAISSVRSLLSGGNYTQSQIDAMMIELQNAISNLVLLPFEPEPETPTPKPPVYGGDYLYELTPEQKKYANLLGGVTTQHLTPVKEGVEENISVARNYGFWVWVLVLAPVIFVAIARSFLGSIGSNIRLDMTPYQKGVGIGFFAKHGKNVVWHSDDMR